ncbi:MAG: hypothetical protein HQ498_02990 [Pseudohongiella sp.]|nr:hypothetical protein [Pseudohongiella sp.]
MITKSVARIVVLQLCFALLALHQSVQAADKNWTVGRTIDGQANLQGVWENNSITPVERPEIFGERATLSDEEMVFLNRRIGEIIADGGDALFGEGVLQAAFSGEVKSYDPSTGNYDQQWMVDRKVHNRTSQIIDPSNGRFPAKTEQALAHEADLRAYAAEHPADSWTDRSLSERCVHRDVPNLGSGYNSYWQIVQAADHVSIIQEMFHDVRMIPLIEKPPLDEKIKLWNGSSRGYWDGDTLVIDTKNFNEKNDPGLNTEARIYQERLTRINESQLQYDIVVHDPGTYTDDYTRRIIFDNSEDQIYEYACHEGNYGMMNILSGHRAEERMALGARQNSN